MAVLESLIFSVRITSESWSKFDNLIFKHEAPKDLIIFSNVFNLVWRIFTSARIHAS